MTPSFSHRSSRSFLGATTTGCASFSSSVGGAAAAAVAVSASLDSQAPGTGYCVVDQSAAQVAYQSVEDESREWPGRRRDDGCGIINPPIGGAAAAAGAVIGCGATKVASSEKSLSCDKGRAGNANVGECHPLDPFEDAAEDGLDWNGEEDRSEMRCEVWTVRPRACATG